MKRYVPVFQEYVLPKIYDFDFLSDKEGVLELHILGEQGERLVLIFDSYFSYRKIDEGSALQELNDLSQSKMLGRFFYQVYESEFAEWFACQSYGIRGTNNIKHYSVHTIDDIIDVLALNEPEIFRPQE